MVNKCYCCMAVVPEGLQICPTCMMNVGTSKDEIEAVKQLIDVNRVLGIADGGNVENAIQGILNIAGRLRKGEHI